MNKLIKKIVAIAAVLIVAVWMLSPGIAQAATIEDLETQIALLLEQITTLQEEIATLGGGSPAVTGCTITGFDRALKLAMTGDDVKCLQIILNSATDTQLAATGVGSPGNETSYFGPSTEAAVIKFQEKYTSDILAPHGLTLGTGYVGTTTRGKLNSFLVVTDAEKKAASEITNATECVTADYEWYDNVCHEKSAAEKAASEITNATECVVADYEWYDATCHEVGEEVTIAANITDPVKCVTSGYEWYSEGCHETGIEAGFLTITRAVEPRSQKVTYGAEEVPALGIDLEAEGNEVTITQIELKVSADEFAITDNDEVISISIYDGDRVIAAKAISDDIKDGKVGFYGLEEKIAEDTTKTWVVKVCLADDEKLSGTIAVGIAPSAIKYTDSLGNRETGPVEPINPLGISRSITVTDIAELIGAIKASKDTDLNPVDRSLEVGKLGEDDVVVLVFDVEETTENEDVIITNLNIEVTSSEDLDVSLYVDNVYIDEISVMCTGSPALTTFEDVDVKILAGKSKSFRVYVNFPGIVEETDTYTVTVDLPLLLAADLTSDVCEETDTDVVVKGASISGSTLTALQSLVYPQISNVWTIEDGKQIIGGGMGLTTMMRFTVTAIGGDITWGSWDIVDADTYQELRPLTGYDLLFKIRDITDSEKTELLLSADRSQDNASSTANAVAITDYVANDLTYYLGSGVTVELYNDVIIAEDESRDFEVLIDGGLLTAGSLDVGPPEVPTPNPAEAKWFLENNHYALMIVGFENFGELGGWYDRDNTPEDSHIDSLVSGEVIFNYVAPAN